MSKSDDDVAPFTGAWIEMPDAGGRASGSTVAPFTGAWIEMSFVRSEERRRGSRTLHGCVD